jgi:hypothetical protein
MATATRITTPKEPRRTETKTITPRIAEKFLERNVNNYRKVTPNHVRFLATEMSKGEWCEDTGESIKFDWFGDLIDGQHRLRAVVESGVPVKMRVEYGLDPRTVEVIDHHRRARNYADILGRRGFANTCHVAAAARLLWYYLQRNPSRSSQKAAPTNGDLDAILEAHPGLPESARVSHCLPWIKSSRSKTVAHYIFGLYDGAARDTFFAKLESGEVSKGEPEWLLRRFALEGLGSKRRLSEVEYLALMTKAFKARAHNTTLGLLRWTSSESFPYLAGLPYMVDDEPESADEA